MKARAFIETAVAVMAICAALAWAQNDDERHAEQPRTTQELRLDLAASRACDGQPFEWQAGVLVCYRERQ